MNTLKVLNFEGQIHNLLKITKFQYITTKRFEAKKSQLNTNQI